MKARRILILIFLFSTLLLGAQDIHFSQYNLSPITLNPANTGAFNGDWRIASNFRTQWRKLGYPYNTFGLSYDRPIYGANNNLGLGLVYIHDISGDAKLNIDKFFLSGAYLIQAANNALRIGAQLGFGRKSFDISQLTFPDQYDPNTGTFNNGLPNNEIGYATTKSYLDANIGVNWEQTNENNKIQAGLALFHLNRPNESFFNSDFRTPIRTVLHVSLTQQLNEKLALYPRILYLRQNKAAELTLGVNAIYALAKNSIKATNAYIGIQTRDGFNRNTDSYIGIIGLQFERLDIGFSYDLNASSVQYFTDKNGAFELAIIFWSGLTRLKPYSVPCDRY